MAEDPNAPLFIKLSAKSPSGQSIKNYVYSLQSFLLEKSNLKIRFNINYEDH